MLYMPMAGRTTCCSQQHTMLATDDVGGNDQHTLASRDLAKVSTRFLLADLYRYYCHSGYCYNQSPSR